MLDKATLERWEALRQHATANGIPLLEALAGGDFLRTPETIRRDRAEFYRELALSIRDIPASSLAVLTPVGVRDAIVEKMNELLAQIEGGA